MKLKDFEPILLRYRRKKPLSLDEYLKIGGYQALEKALFDLTEDDIIQEVIASGLRGRGGAGFPTGLKWSFVPRESIRPKYVVVNFDEGEPGTFKDRDIVRFNPHLLIEGTIIAARAILSEESYVYVRAEYLKEYQILLNAVQEAEKRGLLGKYIMGSQFSHRMKLFLGAGAYICGEETALLESLEGKQGLVRLRPPYPSASGLYGSPTIINNVETLANVPLIIKNGSEWFRQFGTEQSPGTKIFSLSGSVKNPGNYELPLGSLTLREIIEDLGGGTLQNRKLIGVFPGGLSSPVLTFNELDVSLDYESLAKAGTMLGSGAVIVMDDSIPVLKYARRMVQFFAHESCGKCTPCREGTPWLLKIMYKIESGEGTPRDIDLLKRIIGGIHGTTLCPLGDSCAVVLKSFLDKFPEDFLIAVKSHQISISKT